MIELTEEIFCNAAKAVRDTLSVEYQGTVISFERPWRRASMNDLVKERSGLDILSMVGDLAKAKEEAVAFLQRDDLDLAKLGVEKQAVRGGIPDARAVRGVICCPRSRCGAAAAASAATPAHSTRARPALLPPPPQAETIGHLLNVMFETLVEKTLARSLALLANLSSFWRSLATAPSTDSFVPQ